MRVLRIIASLVLAALLLAFVSPGLLLAALPVLAGFVALAFGRYPGETVLERLRSTRRPRTRRRPGALRVAASASRVLAPTGTALLAFGRAVRPPPVAC